MTLSLPAQSWRQSAPALAPRPSASRPLHDAQALCGQDGLAHIQLGDQTYTLRITRAGKLILTK